MSKVLHILFYKPLPEKLPPLPGLLRKLRKLGEVKQQILTSVKQREMNLMFKQCHVWFCSMFMCPMVLQGQAHTCHRSYNMLTWYFLV